MYTTSDRIICVITLRAPSHLHALTQEGVLEVIVGTRLDAALGSDVNIEERCSCVRTGSDAGAIERVGIIKADKHAETERGVRDISHTLVASLHAGSGRIVGEVSVRAERDTGVRGPVCE